MRSLTLLVMFATGLLAAPVPKELREKRPDYCPMTVGDVREYVHPDSPTVVSQTRSITAVEVRNGAKYFTQEISTGQKVVMKVDKTGVYLVSSGSVIYDPPYKAIGPDIKPGDTWECKDANGMTRTVGKPEKIVTPAGTFTAYPLTIEYTKLTGVGKPVLWYSDGIGMVRYDSGTTPMLVLSKFTPGKEKK